MDELQQSFWWTVAASSAGSVALLGIAAFLGRSQLTHWLSKDLERTKNQYQRELEAYKVSLIAEAERAKSTAAIKQAGALMILGREYDVLSKLYSATISLSVEVFTASKRVTKTAADVTAVAEAMNQFLHTSSEARPFFDVEGNLAFTDCWEHMREIIAKHCEIGSPAAGDEGDPAAGKLIYACEALIAKRMREMATI